MEVAVLYVILRPWSYCHSWKRPAAAWLLFLPWSAFLLAVTMHNGPITGGHALWLVLIDFSLFVTAVVSLGARRRDVALANPRHS